MDRFRSRYDLYFKKDARLAIIEGEEKAAQMLHPVIHKLFQTEDAKEGVASFLERRKANFKGC